MPLTYATLRRIFEEHTPETLPAPAQIKARAAVALIFAGDEAQMKLLFIRRALRDTDRWSGQMAFPGGRADLSDADMLATARRETLEEVGVTLPPESLLGAMDELALNRHGDSRYGVLSPFVFALPDELPRFTLDPGEVDAAFWIDLTHLSTPLNADTLSWQVPDLEAPLRFPAIRFDADLIWGLTYRVLMDFARLTDFALIGKDDFPLSLK